MIGTCPLADPPVSLAIAPQPSGVGRLRESPPSTRSPVSPDSGERPAAAPSRAYGRVGRARSGSTLVLDSDRNNGTPVNGLFKSMISFHASLSGSTRPRWPQTAHVASAAGFQAVDIELTDIEQEAPRVVEGLLSRAGLRAGAAPLPVEFRRDEDAFRRDLAALPPLAEMAAAIGVRTLCRSLPASSDVPKSDLLPLLQRRVSACADILSEHGLNLAIEVVAPLHLRRRFAHEFMWRLPEGGEFARSCGPHVGVLVDSWHWHHAGGSQKDIVDLGDRVFHVHVADAPDLPADAIRDEQRLLPGAGVIDFAAFFRALNAVGYSSLVTPEIFGYGCESDDPVRCARAALQAVSGLSSDDFGLWPLET